MRPFAYSDSISSSQLLVIKYEAMSDYLDGQLQYNDGWRHHDDGDGPPIWAYWISSPVKNYDCFYLS